MSIKDDINSDIPENNIGRFWMVLAIVATAGLAVFAAYSWMHPFSAVSAITHEQKPLDYPIEDTNQTRTELFKIVNDQRAKTYGSYVTEYAFCKAHLGKPVKIADTPNVEVIGVKVTATIECEAEDGFKQQWKVEYNTETNDYKESLVMGSMA